MLLVYYKMNILDNKDIKYMFEIMMVNTKGFIGFGPTWPNTLICTIHTCNCTVRVVKFYDHSEICK